MSNAQRIITIKTANEISHAVFRRFIRSCCCVVLVIFGMLGHSPLAFAKDNLVIGVSQFASTFNPHFDAMLVKYTVLNMAMRPITTYDAQQKLICVLCVELPTFENGLAVEEPLDDGGRGIALTYTLLPNLAWGDGTPVSTRDVVFTIEAGQHPDAGFIGGEQFRRILAVDVIDDRTFTLHIDRITYDYNDMGLYLLPEHIEAFNFSDPREYRNRTAYDTSPTNEGLYHGPYRIAEVQRGAFVKLVRNESWQGRQPAFDQIVVRTIENTAALEANLLSGAIDLIDGALGLSLDQALNFEKRHGDKYTFLYQPTLFYEHIELNLDNAVLADSRVRQALLHALDRKTLVERLFEGKQPVAHTFVSPIETMFWANVPKYEYSVEQANKLLDEAGWTSRRGGIRHNYQGAPLRLEFSTTAGARSRELVQQVLQSNWKDVGIDAKIKNRPARVFFGEDVLRRNYSAMVMFSFVFSPEQSPRRLLHSNEIPSEENNYSGNNFPGYKNPKMDKLIERLEVELDVSERTQIWHEIQRLYSADLPALPLYFQSERYIIPKWLENLQATGNASTPTLWVEYWTVAE